MTSERLNPVKRLNLERIIFITFYPFQSLPSLVGISGLVLRLYPVCFVFLAGVLAHRRQSLSGERSACRLRTLRTLGTINFHLNDGTSYCTATLTHADAF